MMLKQNQSSKSQINDSKLEINTQSKVKESIVEESIVEESKGEESKEHYTKEQESKEEQIKRKYNIAEELRCIFKTVPDITKLLDRNDLDAIERRDKYLFNLHYSTILEYQSIKI